MSHLAAALLALATLTTGCAAMGTKRAEGGTQIQRSAQSAPTADSGALTDARPELGQR